MPMNQTSVIHQPVCFPQNSIITSHPTQHLHLLHPQETPSPIHAVPSLVNDDIAEVENTHSPEVQCTTNQVRSIESSDRQVTDLSTELLDIPPELCYLWRQSHGKTLRGRLLRRL